MRSSSMERKALGRIVGYSDKWRSKFLKNGIFGNVIAEPRFQRIDGPEKSSSLRPTHARGECSKTGPKRRIGGGTFGVCAEMYLCMYMK
jgi:hypothetical protein